MKKIKSIIFTALALLIFTGGTVDAKKSDIFTVGDNNVNIQLGAGNNWYYDDYYHSSLPQLSVSYDHGLRDDWGPGVFGVGFFTSACTYRYNYNYQSIDKDYRVSEFNLAGRATYHYQYFDRVDTYGGIVAGLKFKTDNIPEDYSNEEGIWPMGAVLAGIKYYFTDNVSVMSELYIGQVAFFNIGIGLKF